MKKLIQHPIVIITIVLAAAAAVAVYGYANLNSKPKYELTEPIVKNIRESVGLNGTVKAAEAVNLGFEIGGKTSAVAVSVGDAVASGAILAELSSDSLQADLSSANSALLSAEAENGLKSTELINAQSALDNAERSLSDKINNGYTVADDAVRTEASQFFNNPASQNDSLMITIPDRQMSINLINSRYDIEVMLNQWSGELASTSQSVNLSKASAEAKQNLSSVSDFLDVCAAALNQAVSSLNVSSATIAVWKTAISAARINTAGAISALIGAENQFISAQSAFDLAKQEVNGSSSNQVSVSDAALLSAKAAVEKINAEIERTILRAPFSGVITEVDAKVGQIVSAGATEVSMISNNNYQVESYVSESDLGKLRVGQEGQVTLDAYGAETLFPVTVVSIDPAATIQSGVSAYKVTLQFKNQDKRIRAGMTANASIVTAEKQDVLTVPAGAVIERGNDKYVMSAGAPNKIPALAKVTTGIYGDDGTVEILSGITKDDWIVGLTSEYATK